MSKRQKTIEKLIEEVLVLEKEQPYEVPGNWVWTNIDTITKEIKNGTTTKQNKDGLGVKVTRIESVQNNEIDLNRIGYIEKINSIKEIDYYQSGDIVLSHINSIEHVGKTVLIEGEVLPLVHGMNLLRIRLFKEKLFPLYVQYYMRSYQFKKDIRDRVNRAVNQVSLNQKKLKEVLIPVAPLNEQKRIAEKVERLLSKIEEAKCLIEETKKTVKMQFNAVLIKAFNGDLTLQWRQLKGSQLTREEFVAQLRNERLKLCKTNKDKEYYSECFQSLLEKMEDMPDGWIMVPFEMICHNITKGTTPQASDITLEGDVPFLKVYNIVNNKIDFEYKPSFIPKMVNENKLKRSRVYPGDVLMNIVGPPLGKVAIVPYTYPEWNINQAIAIYRPIKGVLNEYIYYSLLYEKTLAEVFQETRGVVGQSNISLEQCRKLKVALPSLDEQKEIVKSIKYTFEKLKIVENNIQYLSTLLEKTVESVLSKAFRGELGTNDPSEENAIELLKEVLQEQVK